MSNDYLQDIEKALEAVNKAIEAVDLAEETARENGIKIHSSIGNRLYTAKVVVTEALQVAMEEREKNPQLAHLQKESQTNTKINYLYRDADNYKVYNECVIDGLLTPEQQAFIISCLDEGEYFIPSLVGMPEVKFDEVDTEADHQWFELQSDGFESTTQKADISATPEELVSAFSKCKDNWMNLYSSGIPTAHQKSSLDVNIQPALSSKAISEFIFDNEILISEDFRRLEGYVWATNPLVSRLQEVQKGEHSPAELQSMANINFYPVFEPAANEITMHGNYEYYSSSESYRGEYYKGFVFSLSKEESSSLIAAFEDYCKKTNGKSCLDFLNAERRDSGLPELPKASLASRIADASTKAGKTNAAGMEKETLSAKISSAEHRR